jgi:hypothetical protein
MGLSPVWIASISFNVAAVVLLLLTRFGMVAGGLVIAPILFGIGITIGAVGAGLRSPWAVLIFMAIVIIAFELVFYFNVLGGAV